MNNTSTHANSGARTMSKVGVGVGDRPPTREWEPDLMGSRPTQGPGPGMVEEKVCVWGGGAA